MGSCLNKRNNIIIKKYNKPVDKLQIYSTKLNNKNNNSSKSLDSQINEFKKIDKSFLTLYSNDIHYELNITDIDSNDTNDNNFKTFKELLEYF